MISNEELIYNKILELYPNNFKKLTEISKNTNDNNLLLECDNEFFDFDIVENCHINYESQLHKSPDSLIFHKNTLYFVEYKEGKSCTKDIRAKIHEAIATLHSICKKHLPQLTRSDFFALNIRYAVFLRKGNPATFLTAINNVRSKYHLKNLEGYLLKKTKVSNDPNEINDVLRKLTAGNLGQLIVHNREYDSITFSN